MQRILRAFGGLTAIAASLIGAAAHAETACESLTSATTAIQTIRYSSMPSLGCHQENVCDCQACQNGAYACCSAIRRGWHLEAEGLLWKARRGNATPYGGVSSPLTGGGLSAVSQDIVGSATDYDQDLGFRTGLRYVGSELWEIYSEYTHLQTSGGSLLGSVGVDSDSIHANLLDRSLADNVGLNGFFDDGLVDLASERLDLHYNVFDVQIGRSLSPRPGMIIRPFSGVRIGRIDQASAIMYQNVEGDLDWAAIDLSTDTIVAGLRFGTDNYWSPRRGPLSLHSKFAVSMLYGHIESSRSDNYWNESSSTRGLINYRTAYQTVLPVLELGAGLRYDRGPWFVQSGYEFANWFNLDQRIDSPGWDDVDGRTGNYRTTGGDLAFDGWNLRVGLVW